MIKWNLPYCFSSFTNNWVYLIFAFFILLLLLVACLLLFPFTIGVFFCFFFLFFCNFILLSLLLFYSFHGIPILLQFAAVFLFCVNYIELFLYIFTLLFLPSVFYSKYKYIAYTVAIS